MVKIIDGCVNDGNGVYYKGDTVSHLSREEEAQLVKAKVAEYVGKMRDSSETEIENELETATDEAGEDDNESEESDKINLNFNEEDYIPSPKKTRK
jgi:hypothetical protein